MFLASLKAKFHYTSWFGASSELASVMEFGFYTRIPQRFFYGQLSAGVCGQLKQNKDHLKVSLKACDINSDAWEVAAADMTLWISVRRSAVETSEKAGPD